MLKQPGEPPPQGITRRRICFTQRCGKYSARTSTKEGSLVDDEKLRFDFSHFEAVTDEELSQIEQLVNEEILRNTEVVTEEMAIEAAREKGAMALFGEKYSQSVRC